MNTEQTGENTFMYARLSLLKRSLKYNRFK